MRIYRFLAKKLQGEVAQAKVAPPGIWIDVTVAYPGSAQGAFAWLKQAHPREMNWQYMGGEIAGQPTVLKKVPQRIDGLPGGADEERDALSDTEDFFGTNFIG